jgi:hypothetical protein
MNIRIFFIVIIAAVAIGGISFYKKFSSSPIDKTTICIFSSNTPGTKDDIRFIRQALQLYDIKRDQIIENPKLNYECENTFIKIILDQKKFDKCTKKDDSSLKIGIRLHDHPEEENPKIISLFEEDNTEALLDLAKTIVKKTVICLLVYDKSSEHSKRLAMQYQELAKIKEVDLRLCVLSANRNIPTLLKEVSENINAVIFVPGEIVFSDSELILEFFKIKKIPVFANHAGLIRAGALGGYDFDTQEISHSIAEISSCFLRDTKNIKSDAFDELYPQLHLNMDTIGHLGIQLDSEDLLGEAVTVGGADL